VWLAARRRPFVQQAALKIVKAGAFQTTHIAAFEAKAAAP
jgi:hypothetical protein